MSEHHGVRSQLADPALPPAELAQIAHEHPELRPRVAAHPAAYPDLLTWLGQLGDPAVDAVLTARGGAHESPPARRRGPLLAVVGGVAALALAGGAFALSQRGDDAPQATPEASSTSVATATSSPSRAPEPTADPTAEPTADDATDPPPPTAAPDPGVTLAGYPSAPEVTWQVDVGDIAAGLELIGDVELVSPRDYPAVIAAGDAIILAVAGEDRDGLAALDPVNRAVAWTRFHDATKVSLRGCAGAAGQSLLVCGYTDAETRSRGWVDAIDAHTGELIETIDLPAPPHALTATAEGGAFVGAADDLYYETGAGTATLAEIARDGTLLWSTTLPFTLDNTPNDLTIWFLSNEHETMARVGDDTYLLNRHGGSQLVPGVFRRARLGPDLVLQEYSTGFSDTDYEVALARDSGSEELLAANGRLTRSWEVAHRADRDRPLLVATVDELSGWDPTAAEKLWSYPVNADVRLVTDDLAVVNGFGESFMIDRRTGDRLWDTEGSSTVFSDGERIVDMTFGETVQARSARDGSLEWQIDIPPTGEYDYYIASAVGGWLTLVSRTDVVFYAPTS